MELLLHWFKLVYASFQSDQCLLRASALTYVTALSIVPFLAVAFSISKGLGFQNTDYIKEFLLKISAGRETVAEYVIGYINNTNVSTLGAVGVGVLLVTVFSLLGAIEQSLNTIWGVKSQRTLGRKFSDYLSVTLVAPLLIIVATSFTASLQSITLVQKILSISVFSYIYLAALQAMPYVLVCLAIFFIYKFMPNAPVNTMGCIIGSIFAGVLWQGLQKLFITYQIGVSKYNAIYGSFAQLPLFLIWLYLSWVIVLLGAEICFCWEHYRMGLKESSLGEFNIHSKEAFALAALGLITKGFEQRQGLIETNTLAWELGLPVKLVNRLLYVLSSLGVVARSMHEEREGYTLKICPHSYTVLEFLKAFRTYADEHSVVYQGASGTVPRLFEKIYADGAERGLDMSLSELSERLEFSSLAEASGSEAAAPAHESKEPAQIDGTSKAS
jgi:membrane protein